MESNEIGLYVIYAIDVFFVLFVLYCVFATIHSDTVIGITLRSCVDNIKYRKNISWCELFRYQIILVKMDVLGAWHYNITHKRYMEYTANKLSNSCIYVTYSVCSFTFNGIESNIDRKLQQNKIPTGLFNET